MTEAKVVPVIMSGGAGSRLWPLSRADRPKQFHALAGDETLLATTLARVAGRYPEITFEPYVIMSSAAHATVVQAHLPGDAPCGALIYEPCVRSTAPAVAVATRFVADTSPDACVLMLASDAHIADAAAFRRAIADGAAAAASGGLVTFGIIPDRPETGYGYIKRGEAVGSAYHVEAFVEKPDRETAERYLAEGRYDWNAGIFLFRPSDMAGEFERQAPDIWEQAGRAYDQAARDGHSIYLAGEPFAACRTESVDFAVMEGARDVKVVPVDMGWNDIGSWRQVHDILVRDEDGNALGGDVIAVDARNNLVRGAHRLTALVGVENLAVVETPDATLIAQRDRTQDVKRVVEALKAADRSEHLVSAVHARSVLPAQGRVPEVRRWLFDAALPLWAEHGLDLTSGGVVERLDFDARPVPGDNKRLRVLARQIYVYSHAKLMGFDDRADNVIAHGLAHLLGRGWHPDGGWIHLFGPDGSVVDARRDTYDQAFVIFALAWAYRATRRDDLVYWLDRTLAFLDAELADAVNGGYREAVPATLPRRANPHMHLLEAMLAAHAATGSADHLARAGALVDLFESRLFDADTWTLTEFFSEDWKIAEGPEGRIAEPGHHYEWVWLLSRFAARSGRDLSVPCRRLFAFAEAFGRDPRTGRVYDEVDKDGRVLKSTARSWPQTEALKALLAMRGAGYDHLDHRIDETVAVLFGDYFNVTRPGGWMDQFDSAGNGIAEAMPASTFYHAFSACAEFLRTFDDPAIPSI